MTKFHILVFYFDISIPTKSFFTGESEVEFLRPFESILTTSGVSTDLKECLRSFCGRIASNVLITGL